jgi:hypothetical protein
MNVSPVVVNNNSRCTYSSGNNTSHALWMDILHKKQRTTSDSHTAFSAHFGRPKNHNVVPVVVAVGRIDIRSRNHRQSRKAINRQLFTMAAAAVVASRDDPWYDCYYLQ